MPEKSVSQKAFLHRGRLTQIPIYLGKQLRGLIYQNDWKVLPMAAIIAAVVSLVIKGSFFVTSEGTLRGSFALTCVAIWNGCFNSIQVICRERSIIKRDHRSGMHITSYIASHMLYQALICLAQTVVTVLVCVKCGVQFPAEGVVFRSFLIEIGVTVFLISYASDMISLFISALVRTTTAAMTVMPFILIFQLVFSGGFFALPGWGVTVSQFTTAHYGLCCMNAQADFNSLGSTIGWNALASMRGEMVSGSVTLGQITELLTNKDNGMLRQIRDKKITQQDATMFLAGFFEDSPGKTVLLNAASELAGADDYVTWGEILDGIAGSKVFLDNADMEIPFAFSIKQIMDLFGEENIRDALMTRMAVAGQKDDYVHTEENIRGYWNDLLLTALLFALLSVIALEFIDKDKR